MLQTIYFSLPVYLQNRIVSLYGKRMWNGRYSGYYQQIAIDLLATYSKSEDEICHIINSRLSEIICYSAKAIPYYKKIFCEYGIDPASIKDQNDLKQIPVLEKETLRNYPDLFIPDDIKKRKYLIQKTSGSTGTPLKVYVDKFTYQLAMALLVDHEKRHGVNLGEARATFAGRMIQPIKNFKPPFWRYNSAENQMLFSSYHLSDKTAKVYFDELNRFHPKEIIGYPSSIYSMAYYIKKNRWHLTKSPKIIVTNSETLFGWQREIIEYVFKCKVYDYYGTSEYVVFAGQCTNMNYHINPFLGIMESVGTDGSSVLEKEGDIICTTLTNKALPLIRYRVGDTCILSNEKCKCGCHYRVLKSVEGRIDDVVVTRDGRRIGRLDHIFKGVNGIKECQVVQDKVDMFTLNIVKGSDFNTTDAERIVINLKDRVDQNIEVNVNYLEEIKKTSRGKFKGVISYANRP